MQKNLSRTIVWKTQLVMLTLFFHFGKATAQLANCNCKENFAFVKAYMEHNHAAFNDNVTAVTRNVYDKFCKKIASDIQFDSCRSNCGYFLSEYLHFFKDKHIYIQENINPVNESDSSTVSAVLQSEAYKNAERIAIDSNKIKSLEKKDRNEIEGIYHSFPYPGYTIALIIAGRIYKAVVLESSSVLWKGGQVKFTLSPVDKSVYDAKVFMKDHSLQRKKVQFSNGTFEDLYFTKDKELYNQSEPLFVFRQLNDSTNYLHVNSFLGYNYTILDSFYKASYNVIISKPYLVLDVRNNGGGSDNCYQGLLDFIYSGPMKNDMLDIYVTPENLNTYKKELEHQMKDSANYGRESILKMQQYVHKMEMAKPYTFISMDNENTSYLTREKVLPYPKKVALIYNHFSASSCEGFILYAQQSKKVTSFGENSGGYTGYGNVFTISVPNSNLFLGCTTTRYRLHRKYDGIGITPEYKLNFTGNWLSVVLKQLTKQ